MHGEQDPRATAGEGRRVFEALTAEKQWVVFEGVGHRSCARAQPGRWRTTVGAFLKGLDPATSKQGDG
jgi:hypothetical protein